MQTYFLPQLENRKESLYYFIINHNDDGIEYALRTCQTDNIPTGVKFVEYRNFVGTQVPVFTKE